MRYGSKTYIRIPGGEVQYGHRTGRLAVWFRRRLYVLRRGRVA